MYIIYMSLSAPKRSPLALAVLVLLYEEPMHVYRMRQLIKRRGEDEVINVIQPNSLYQTIARLEREGLLIAGGVDRDSNRPERTVYELTDTGKTTLVRWTRDMLSAPSREFPEFPAAISVLPVLTPKDALTQLEKRIAVLEPEIARHHARIAASHFLPRLFRLEVELLHAQATAELRWVQSIAGDLRAGRLTWSKAWLKKAVKELTQQPCDESEGV
ncbi:PadR family transcriptional regulator [Granulicella sp. WH15]|uniref:PadR family transcriptional regulator n=1 Tax=Granulicella sp. WH15 TaxID=2602070 RepID=UPI001C706622|nr:PadR family transcriptional regulator [Granulicella sp. WH15]